MSTSRAHTGPQAVDGAVDGARVAPGPESQDADDADTTSEGDLAHATLDDLVARVSPTGRPGRVGQAGRSARRGRRGGLEGEVRRGIRRENLMGRNRGGYSGPGFDPATDPQRIGSLMGGFVDENGWERPLAEARVFAEWPQLVGADVAAHSTPESLRDGELRIQAESSAWATQLRLLASTLLARLVAELGPQVVTKLVISGPTAPSWKHGSWSVRGARGPRDTYG